MARADFRFFFPKRVRFAEIDAQAVLFNSRYLEYFDIGAVEYWRAVGMLEHTTVSGGAEFHVAKAEVLFRRVIRIDEMIDIAVRCSRIGRTSMTFAFELHGAGADDLRASGEEVQVHVGHAGGAPEPVPDWCVNLFEAYEGRTLRA
jgi:acyl-CoA thioester hydrolase